MRKLLLSFLFMAFTVCHAQKNVFVPYRVGNLYGLSDVKGNLKYKPQHDIIEPIGNGYFKFVSYQKVQDTVHYYGGHFTIKENIKPISGVLQGNKVIIDKTNHRHFTYLEEGLLIGSEESYISKNSNFYTLTGEKLLAENAEKFRILELYNRAENSSKQPALAILVEHFDHSVSLLQFSTERQKLLEPLLDRVTDFKIDAKASNESYFVCSYSDTQSRYNQVSIHYDNVKKHYVIEPYSSQRKQLNATSDLEKRVYMGQDDYDIKRLGTSTISIETQSTPSLQEKHPKPVYYFVKDNNNLIQYGAKAVQIAADEKVIFAEQHIKTQREPLIFIKGKQKGLILSESERSELMYDSLQFIRNQSRVMPHDHSYIYLAGKKNEATGKWLFGILGNDGKELVPIVYESLVPNLLESHYNNDMATQKGYFEYRQPYTYSSDKNQLLKLYSNGFFMAKQNGKQGLINLVNEVIMPFEYDLLWKNGLNFMKTAKISDEFNVYQKGDRYGVFLINAKGEKTLDTGLIFPKMPVYVYQDYMGIKGFDLYNLADADNLSFCLAGSNGKVYYRKK